jgi:hypothetical protein
MHAFHKRKKRIILSIDGKIRISLAVSERKNDRYAFRRKEKLYFMNLGDLFPIIKPISLEKISLAVNQHGMVDAEKTSLNATQGDVSFETEEFFECRYD